MASIHQTCLSSGINISKTTQLEQCLYSIVWRQMSEKVGVKMFVLHGEYGSRACEFNHHRKRDDITSISNHSKSSLVESKTSKLLFKSSLPFQPLAGIEARKFVQPPPSPSSVGTRNAMTHAISLYSSSKINSHPPSTF